jgi:ABC-type multidrug transport system ATPase subunit
LCGLLKASSGSVRLNGKPIKEAKREFGYVAQNFGLYEELTVRENMNFYGSVYGVHSKERSLALLHRYGLIDHIDKHAGKLSGGFQRRLAVACALIHDPDILFLDEPTAGIDPVTRKLMWDDLYQLSAEGKTLFVTTHYMEEAQRCDQLAFIVSGVISAEGTPVSILESLGDARVYAADISYHPDIQSAVSQEDGVLVVNQFGNQLRITATPETDGEKLQDIIFRSTGASCVLQQTKPNLEDVFIAINKQRISN